MKSRSFWENRPLAWVGLALIVLLAIFLGANRTVASLSGKVEKAYTERTEAYGSVAEDLGKYADYASRLSSLAGDGGEELRKALSLFDEEKSSPFGVTHGIDPVHRAAAAVYQTLQTSGEEETAKKATLYFYEMDSTRMRLRNNASYARAAARYNAAVKGFPASLLTFGRKEAVTFD